MGTKHLQAQFEMHYDICLINKKTLLNLKVLLSFIQCWVQTLMLEFINLVIFNLLVLIMQYH